MTGLVYLAIIALWVMFLIPWLGRHRDEHSGRKTADRYHRAMDTLARAGHNIRHPRDEDDSLTEEEADEIEAMEAAAPSGVAVPGIRDAWRVLTCVFNPSAADRRSTAAKRRRRVLLLLVAALAGSIGGALAGLVPGAAAVIVAGLLVAYLALMVRQATRAGLGAPRRAGSAETDRYREETRRAQAQARGLLNPQQRTSKPAAGWDAVPTTLPTYVTKPKASKVPRVMDLTSPGRGWTGEQMVQRAQEETRRRAEDAAREQFEREMAVLRPDPVQEVAELANPTDQAVDQHRNTYRRAANG